MSAPTQRQVDALKRIWATAQRDHGGSEVCVQFLLGLYNGPHYRFDLTELRRLDTQHMQDVLDVLVMDWCPQREIHEQLNLVLGRNDIGDQLVLLGCDWQVRGHCAPDQEKRIRAQLAQREGVTP